MSVLDAIRKQGDGPSAWTVRGNQAMSVLDAIEAGDHEQVCVNSGRAS